MNCWCGTEDLEPGQSDMVINGRPCCNRTCYNLALKALSGERVDDMHRPMRVNGGLHEPVE